MAGTIKGIIVEIGGDTSGLQTALSKVNSATSSLTKELKGINSLLKLDPSNTELLAQKQEVLAEQIEETSEKLKLLKEAQEEADEIIANGGEISQENYRNLQREIISTESKLKDLQNQASKWTQAGKKLEEYGTKLENLGTKITKVGNKLSILSTAVLAIGTAAVSSAIEFESAFTGVEKTVDGTEEQLAELKQGIIDLAEEIPSTTTEIAAVAEAAGQLGIATEDVLDFTKVMIDLGNSTNLSADEAASALAKFANITGTAAEDYERLGSVIVDLGNNFATTESDIVDMATNLAASGELAGLTEPQIFALATAMSSVGIEAEAGGSSMSKLLRQIQTAVETGSDDLKNFASVAGMTSSEFKKAFEEDAVEALSAFIEGLNDTERNGKTATVILQDMGITETRLTNTILSLANASDVMVDAIDTANEAWDENTALTEEAEKRYATTESQIQIVKNKFSNLATSLGNKLLPIIEKLLDKASDFVESLENMTDEEQENIIKIGLLVVAIGPLVKILGTLTSTSGKVIKTMGNLLQAISNVKNGIKTAEGQVGTFTTVLTKLTSSSAGGIAVIATSVIMALGGAFLYLATQETEAQKAAEEYAEEMASVKQTLEEYNESVNNTMDTELAHIDNVSNLRNELEKLVDENGQVKEGYEGRVSFILNELNDALGTEYELNNNIIESYKSLQEEIDNLIEKKRAEIILNAQQEKWANAIENQELAIENLKTATENLGGSIESVRDEYNTLYQEIEDYWNPAISKTREEMLNFDVLAKQQRLQELEDLINAYEDAEYVVKTYTEDIKTYEENYALFVEGEYERISNTITTTTQNWCNSSLEEIKNNIQEQSNALETYRQIYEDTGNEVALELANQAQSNLESLASELASRTQTIEELGEDEVLAWQTLAQNGFEQYSYYVSQMAPEMQEKIQEATGVIIANTPEFAEQAGIMGEEVINEFDRNSEAKEQALKTLQGYYDGLTDEEKVDFLMTAVGDMADEVAEQFESGDYDTSGRNVLEGLYNGLSNSTWGTKLINKAASIAKSIANQFNIEWDEHSPSKLMEQKTEYLLEPISTVFSEQENKLVKSASNLAQRIANNFSKNFMLDDIKIPDASSIGNLSNKVIDGTKSVSNTYKVVFNVQELDNEKLEQCFNYVNKKFGSRY